MKNLTVKIFVGLFVVAAVLLVAFVTLLVLKLTVLRKKA